MISAYGDVLTGAINRETVRIGNHGQYRAKHNRAADTKVDRVRSGAGHAIAAGGVAIGIGVVDRFAQAAQTVAGRGVVQKRVDRDRATRRCSGDKTKKTNTNASQTD